MAPRGPRRARDEKTSEKAAIKTGGRPQVPPDTKPRPDVSPFKQQLKHTLYRLLTILLLTHMTNYFINHGSNSNEAPWKVVDLPGRGKGMIATRSIKQGERLMTERPLFVVPREITGSPIRLIKSKLDGISPEQRAAFLELSHADPNITEEEIPLSIFQTNSIAAGESGPGIFPKTARLNHACSAGFNSVYSWREEEKLLVVHALRNVKAGDELLTAYFDTKRPRDERRDHLARIYKFNCSCSICAMPAGASQASDRRLQSMTAAHAKFTTWGRGEINGLEALDLVRKIWRLGDEEGYWSERGSLADDAAHVAAAHSDEEATRIWAALAYKWYGYEVGKDSKQAKAIRAVAEKPKLHPAWAYRERMVVGGLNYGP